MHSTRGRGLPCRRSLLPAVITCLLVLAAGPPAVADDRSVGAGAHQTGGSSPSEGEQREVRLTRARVRFVQRRLGLTRDGIVGRRTRAALRRYQRSNGLPASGRLTRETLRHLRARAPRRPAAPASPARTVEAVVAAARERIGASYRMGGTGPTAYDCSGLTVEAFESAGIELARTSYDQFEQGSAVRRDEIQPGDLVFFDAGAPAPPTSGSPPGGTGSSRRQRAAASSSTASTTTTGAATTSAPAG